MREPSPLPSVWGFRRAWLPLAKAHTPFDKLRIAVILPAMSLQFAYRFNEDVPPSSLRDLDDVVLLVTAFSDDGDTIPAGTEGTIVSVHGDGESFVVEFAEPQGALATIATHNLRAAIGTPR